MPVWSGPGSVSQYVYQVIKGTRPWPSARHPFRLRPEAVPERQRDQERGEQTDHGRNSDGEDERAARHPKLLRHLERVHLVRHRHAAQIEVSHGGAQEREDGQVVRAQQARPERPGHQCADIHVRPE